MKRYKKATIFIILLILACLLISCKGEKGVEPYVGYKPPYLPVRFMISPSGISVAGEPSLVTPLGEFSIGADYSLKRSVDTILVIIRDKNRGEKGFDTIYRVKSGSDEFVAVVNGKTTIQIVDRQILIDVSEGDIESIEFKSADKLIQENSSIKEKWDAFWSIAIFGYKPFALTTWAYDDSTFGKWYGIGFLWFLIRLVIAVIMIIPDLILTLVIGLGTLLHFFIGVTIRNIYYGLLTLGTIIFFFGIMV